MANSSFAGAKDESSQKVHTLSTGLSLPPDTLFLKTGKTGIRPARNKAESGGDLHEKFSEDG
jgi:hypothetical protein